MGETSFEYWFGSLCQSQTGRPVISSIFCRLFLVVWGNIFIHEKKRTLNLLRFSSLSRPAALPLPPGHPGPLPRLRLLSRGRGALPPAQLQPAVGARDERALPVALAFKSIRGGGRGEKVETCFVNMFVKYSSIIPRASPLIF